MAPTTKLEKRVCALAHSLKPLTDKQEQFAFENCFDYTAYQNGKHIHCLTCGHSWKTKDDTQEELIFCPHCHKALYVEQTRRRKNITQSYFCLTTTRQEFQVLRFFLVKRYECVNRQANFVINEVVQSWLAPNGKVTTLARNVRPFSYFYIDEWDYLTPLTIKHCNTRIPSYYQHSGYRYNIAPTATYFARVQPILKRNGVKRSFHNLVATETCLKLLNSPKFETLYKAEQFSAFSALDKSTIDNYWSELKICIRNHYKIADFQLWRDMIVNLKELQKDTHNAKFICPIDLKEAHDYWLKKVNEIREKQRVMQQLRQARLYEEQFYKDKSKYFGIELHKNGICVVVLKSIKEYQEEGSAMHHCVFTNGYYKQRDSLILSARDNDGNRLATVELSLTDYKVLQCRSVCNTMPEKYDEIIQLVEQNARKFRHCA